MNDISRTRRRPGTTEKVRKLRRAGNIAEVRLWSELKDRKLGGFKFVRQLPIGPYYAEALHEFPLHQAGGELAARSVRGLFRQT